MKGSKNMNKEYIWHLNTDNQSHCWKCVVTDTQCIFFEDDIQSGSLPIDDPTQKQGVLQIDKTISVFGQSLPFQLERGIPYLQVEGRWSMSETTQADRQKKALENQKLTGLVQSGLGLLIAVVYLIGSRFFPSWEANWFILVMALFFVFVGLSQVYVAHKALRARESGNEG